MKQSTYLIALGSNRRHHRHGVPRAVIAAALDALESKSLTLRSTSPIVETPPLGPSARRFANAAAIVETVDDPPALLARLKRIEHTFGRRRARRWAARVLDLDIILWSGGTWGEPDLIIPHTEFRNRAFVLQPALTIAAAWRDPVSGHTIRQLAARLARRRPVDRPRRHP